MKKKRISWYVICLFHRKHFKGENMKKLAILLTVVFCTVSFASYAGDNPHQDKKAAREAKKQEQRTKLEKQFQMTSSMIENQRFVLEADWLSNQYGERIPVTSNLNFIRIDTSYAVLQIGSNYGVGYNGVGGVTAEGRLTTWKVHKNEKKLSYTVQANVMTSIGIYDITMMVSADGRTNATITGTRRGQLNYTGQIVPLDDTHTYKGQTTY